MKNEERWEQIIQFVDQRGFLSVQELSGLCDTSVITIRRDLSYLDAQKRLRRTHGGAASLAMQVKPILEVELVPGHPSEPFSLNRLDALITAEYLPKFSGLVQRPNGKKRIPMVAESLPMPDT
jgi:hypothetical protein